MAERRDSLTLGRVAPAQGVVRRMDCELAFQPFLGVTKVQVLDADPDAWLAGRMGSEPVAPGRAVERGGISCAWLAPGEWLLVGDEAAVAAAADRCDAGGDMVLVVDLTHARACFLLSGPGARDALAAHCPLDLSDNAMPVCAATRSVFADTAFFLSRLADEDGSPSYRLIFDQTAADYVVRMIGGTNPPQE